MLPACVTCGCEVGGGAISVIRGRFKLALACSMRCADAFEASPPESIEAEEDETREITVPESMRTVVEGGLT